MDILKSNLFILCIGLFHSSIGLAQEKTFEREYTYNASELDSKSSCRVIAINQLRLEILNEIGVYIESESILRTKEIDGKYSQDFVESISTICAGVTKFKIVEEKWNGESFWMKASITIDEKEIAESLEQVIADRQKLKELEDLKRELKKATVELERLKNAMSGTSETGNDKGLYEDRINTLDAGNHFLSGNEMSIDEDYEAAILEYTRVIEIQPENASAYHNRGIAKANLKDFDGAVLDFSTTIEIDPSHELAYYNRGNAKDDLSDFKGAIVDYNKAIRLNPANSNYYNNRGVAKGHLSDFISAIADYSKAVEMNPQDPTIFYNRALAKLKLGQRDSGCLDLNTAEALGYEQAQRSLAKWCK